MSAPQPPEPPALFGELTGDGQHVILVGQGDSWELRELGLRLKHITPLISKAQGGAVTIPATWAAVTQVAHSLGGVARWVPLPRLREWITAEWTRRTAPPSPLVAEFPPWLALRPYQEEGAARIAAARRYLLCDEPGLGKTATTIAGLMEMHCQHPRIAIFPCVIVVPSWSVADVWVREIATWAPGWTTALYGGPGRAASGSDIYVSTYATARLDAADANGPLVRLRPVTAIADEAHALKGNSTKQSLAFRRIAAHADNVIALTGTPVTKDTGDIYPVLSAMDAASWPSRERFVRRYCVTTDTDYGETIEGLNKLAEPEFRAVLLGSMRRVAKADVLAQLPPKVYSVRRTEIPPEWRKAYDGMADDMLAELPDGGELPVMATLAQMARLSQLACSAADVEVTEEPDKLTGLMKKHYQVTLKAPSWKADALLGILAERRGQPVSVFAVSRQLIEIAGAACEQAGYRCGYITGTTPQRDRAAAIGAFQAGKLDAILATTGAGGTGITLTAAGTAVFLQRPWSLAEALQAEDRQHRLGSERHEMVEIIDVVSVDTIDETVRAALKDKAGQLSAFIREPQLVRGLLGGIE